MQAYLVYGYGIDPTKLNDEELQKVLNLPKSGELYHWYNEKDAGLTTEGIYYLISSSPFDEDRKKYNDPWNVTLDQITKFENNNAERLEKYVDIHNLDTLREHIKFTCSCFYV